MQFETENKSNKAFTIKIALSLFVTSGIPIIFLVLFLNYLPEWRWPHASFHSAVEALGGAIALGVATIFFMRIGTKEDSTHYFFIASALISMGLLDIFHAFVNPGKVFVWLHSTATFFGGLFFGLIWLEKMSQGLNLSRNLIYWITSVTLLFATLSILFPDAVPQMVKEGSFTFLPGFLHYVGAVGFFLATIIFTNRFREKERFEDYLFLLLCALLGMASLIFELSKLWDANWWLWHLLRLIAYSVALTYAVLNLFETQRQLRDSKRQLEIIAKEKTEELSSVNQIIDSVSAIQDLYNSGDKGKHVFERMLNTLLSVSESEYGFIGEVLHKDQKPYLKTYAITNIAWNEETLKLYEDNVAVGLEFYNLETLFGQAIVTKEVIISNDPSNDKRSGGLPSGHPPLNAFLGIPFFQGDEILGMVGLSNKAGGYDPADVEELMPLINSCTEILLDIKREENLRKVQEAEAFLASIVESTDDAVIGKDLNGNILSWNQGAEKIYNFLKGEVVGKNISLLIPEERKQERDYILDKIKAGEKVKNFETLRVKKNGEKIIVALTISPIRNKDGMIVGASTIARDISSRKEMEHNLQEEKSHNQAILDNVVDGIITIDKHGLIQSFNPASERIFGYSKEEVLGKNIKFLMPEPYHSEHDQYIKNYLTSGNAKIIGLGREVEGLRKDGDIFPLELAVSQIFDGEDCLFTGITRDISERKEFENALKEEKEKADSANLSKSRFLANMSHEIRTPMNAVLGYAQILLRKKDLGNDTLEIIKTIHTSGNNLLNLINEILDISKIEAGKMELYPVDFDLHTLVLEMESFFALHCEQKKLNFEVNNLSCPVIVNGDENKLRQILINLIGNALKFTNEGKISLTVRDVGSNNYKFDVKDSGIGIASEAQKNIFEPFQQEAESHKKGGTGLGLVICNKQLDLMGSELHLESKLNEGSVFSFILNLPSGKDEPLKKDLSSGKVQCLAPGFKVRALVVDDVSVNRDVLAQFLTLIGVDVIEAENGLEAVHKVRTQPPDIIFMDMRMPVMDGEEAAKLIQEEFGKDKIKIVVITASALERRREYYLNLGFHEFIGKPFKEDQIFQCLTDLLSVEFTYSDEEKEIEEVFDASGVSLPKEFVDEMRNSAELYNLTGLDACMEKMNLMGDEVKGLQKHFYKLIKSYDMEKILEALDKVSIS